MNQEHSKNILHTTTTTMSATTPTQTLITTKAVLESFDMEDLTLAILGNKINMKTWVGMRPDTKFTTYDMEGLHSIGKGLCILKHAQRKACLAIRLSEKTDPVEREGVMTAGGMVKVLPLTRSRKPTKQNLEKFVWFNDLSAEGNEENPLIKQDEDTLKKYAKGNSSKYVSYETIVNITYKDFSSGEVLWGSGCEIEEAINFITNTNCDDIYDKVDTKKRQSNASKGVASKKSSIAGWSKSLERAFEGKKGKKVNGDLSLTLSGVADIYSMTEIQGGILSDYRVMKKVKGGGVKIYLDLGKMYSVFGIAEKFAEREAELVVKAKEVKISKKEIEKATSAKEGMELVGASADQIKEILTTKYGEAVVAKLYAQ